MRLRLPGGPAAHFWLVCALLVVLLALLQLQAEAIGRQAHAVVKAFSAGWGSP